MRTCRINWDVIGGILGGVCVLHLQAASGQTWANPASGNWGVASNWNPAIVPNSATSDAVVGGTSPFVVSVDISPSLRSLTVTNSNASVALLNGRTLTVNGTGQISNAGTLLVNDTSGASNTFISFGDNSRFSGGGRIVLNAPANRYDSAYVTSASAIGWVLSPGQTLTGQGHIYGTMRNEGTILGSTAYGPAVRGTVNQLNAGQLLADGAGVTASIGEGGRVNGGTLRGVNGGRIATVSGSTSTVSGVTNVGRLELDNGSTLQSAVGVIVNSGEIVVNSTAGSSNTLMSFADNSSLTGTGLLSLNAPGNRYDSAYLTSASAVGWTHGASHTITGIGHIYGTMRNEGTIRGAALYGPSVRGSVNQTGSGQMVADQPDTTVSLGEGGLVSGGIFLGSNGGRVATVSGSTSSVSGVTNVGRFDVDNGSTLQIAAAGLVNNANITVNPSAGSSNSLMFFSDGSSLSGTGTLILNAPGNRYDSAYLTSQSAVGWTHGASHTITGLGHIYGTMRNEGTIRGATLYGPTIRGVVNQSASGSLVSNVTGTTASLGEGGRVNGGTFQGVNGGRIATVSGSTSTVSGVTNLGRFDVDNGSSLQIAGQGFINNGTITINPTSGSSNSLMSFLSSVTVSGTGSVVLGAPGNRLDSAYFTTAPNIQGTFGPGQTVRGRGNVYGRILIQGVLEPGTSGVGSYGQIGGTGTMLLGAGATTRMEIGGPTPAQFDRVDSAGRVELNGSLLLSADPNYNPVCGARHDIIAATTLVGRFSQITYPPTISPFTWRVAYVQNRVAAFYSCLADFDNGSGLGIPDCAVTIDDLLYYLEIFSAGQVASDVDDGSGTGTRDGGVTIDDLLYYLQHFADGC